jgi:dihydrodipicolinate synthase/N-acetylneuraminate lyase
MTSGLSGVFAAILTPFTGDGNVSPEKTRALSAYLAGSGISGVCPAGTTGEFPMLSRGEKALVNSSAASSGAEVIAGCWGFLQDERAWLAGEAEKSGARAVFLTTPVFFKASPESMLAWYRGVRSATRLPVFAYSIPQHTGNPIPLEVLEQLADEGTINGFKDSSGDLEWLLKVIERLKGRITIFAGHEAVFAPARDAGCDGFISGIAGVFPKVVQAVWNGEPGAVDRLLKIRQALHGAGTIPGLKYLSQRRGHDCGLPREPLLPPAGAARDALDRLIEEVSGD